MITKRPVKAEKQILKVALDRALLERACKALKLNHSKAVETAIRKAALATKAG